MEKKKGVWQMDETKQQTTYEPNLLAYQPDTGVTLPSHIMEESDLSPLSGWILLKLLYWAKTRPKFHVTVKGLHSIMKDCQIAPGLPSVRSAIRELESKALLIRGQRRDKDGQMSSDTVYIAVTATAAYDAILDDLKASNITVLSARPENIGMYSGAERVIVSGMERRTLEVSPDGVSTVIDSDETPGRDRGAENCTSGVTCGNADSNETTVENEGKTSVKTVETKTPQNSDNRGETQSVPRSQPMCSLSDVGYSNANSNNGINTIQSNCLNTRPSDSQPYLEDARADEPPCAPSSHPDRFPTSGRTDGRIENGPDAVSQASSLSISRRWIDDPDVCSTVVALSANAVNRNRLSTSSDRIALAERVGSLVEDGYTTREIIEAWRAAQQSCEREGRAPRYFPQLFRWLGDEAPLVLARRRKSKKRPSGEGAKRPEWLDRTIRYNALLTDDADFAALVDRKGILEHELQCGRATAEEVASAQEEVNRYFAEHSAEVA